MPTIQELAGVGENWVPVEGKPIVPGKNNSYAAPPGFASVVNSVPKYNVGSIAPNFQHDVSFVDTQQPTPATPQLHLMPLGLSANSVTSTQITSVVKTSVSPTPPSSNLFYQTIEISGAPQTQRPAFNIIGGTVSDDVGNNSTDLELWYQTVQSNSVAVTQEPALNFLPPLTAVNDAGDSTTDVSISVFGASGPSHSTGAVPDPGGSAGTTRFLREDATWAVVASGIQAAVTVNGTGVSADKQFWINAVLDGSAPTWTVKINGTSDGG